jgi:hypothetical protein
MAEVEKQYWIQAGSSQPALLTATQAAELVVSGAIGWETPACPEGAVEWSQVHQLPELVYAVRARHQAVLQPPALAVSSVAQAPRPAEAAYGRLASAGVPSSPEARLNDYQEQILRAQDQLASLQREIGAVEEAIEIQSFGFYRPQYGFESSDQYAQRLEEVRLQQQEMLKAERAARCEKTFAIDGSVKKGAAMVRDHSKLMLRAFNGESDAAIAKVKYDNVTSLKTRIEKSFTAINKLGESKFVEITPEYLALRVDELHLVHEFREKQHEERQVQRAIKEQMREEQRAEEEIQQALEQAQKDEAQKEDALAKARFDLAESTGRQHEKLEQLVARLETELSSALDRKAKAIARAQLTRSGHVYVLSNVGCFGEDCYKIGMTRRLDPQERVDELGDASVPFEFDVHAMIYSEDAPTLERALHLHFSARRINQVNTRKEFFRVSLDEIRTAVERLHGVVSFVLVPHAKDYRTSLAMLNEPSEPSTPGPNGQ